jgi:hypothetical protein
LGRVGDVDRQCRDQLGLLFGGSRGRGFVEIGRDDPVTLGGEGQGYRLADARPGAGHQGESAL